MDESLLCFCEWSMSVHETKLDKKLDKDMSVQRTFLRIDNKYLTIVLPFSLSLSFTSYDETCLMKQRCRSTPLYKQGKFTHCE